MILYTHSICDEMWIVQILGVQITRMSHLASVIWLCVLLIVLYRLSECRGGKQIVTAVAVILTNGLGDSYWYKSFWSSHAVILWVFALLLSKCFINLKSIFQRLSQKGNCWGSFFCLVEYSLTQCRETALLFILMPTFTIHLVCIHILSIYCISAGIFFMHNCKIY